MTKARIAASTDFSDDSRAAFAAAASVARTFGGELYLVHLARLPAALISPWPEVGPYVMPEDLFTGAEERLAKLAREEAAFAGLDVKPRVVRGETAEALKALVEEEEITLLVMAPHGLSGFKRFLLGSFTEQALRVVPCPVLVVHGRKDGAPFHPRRILVAHDFEPFSRPALAVARGWAEAFQARVRLHFVAESHATLYEYAAHMEGSYKEYLEKVREEALRRFRRIIGEGWRGVEAEAVASVGDPVEEILREAESFGADLLVVGTHTRAGIERLLGGVATKVVRKAPCPVLVVRGAR